MKAGDTMNKKELEDKEPAEQSAIKNNPCGICRAMGKAGCPGHGGGSAGGNSGGSGAAAESNHPKEKGTEKVANVSVELNKWLQPNMVAVFDSKLLSILGDMNNLRLAFQGKPDLSQEEMGLMKEYFKTIQFEFDAFKESLEAQDISTKGFNVVIKGNELMIHIPDQKYYAEFIKQLMDKNFLPSPNPSQGEKKETQKELSKKENLSEEKKEPDWKAPSPFADISKGPIPKWWKE